MAFKLFKQDAHEQVASPVDTAQTQLEHLHLQRSSSNGNRHSRLDSVSPASAERDTPSTTGTPVSATKDKTKRFSRLKATLTRRVSHSSGSGSSSPHTKRQTRRLTSQDGSLLYLAPIDPRSDDVTSQWEKRATMLARAGPPSPALLGRQETIGLEDEADNKAPQIPEMRFDQVPVRTMQAPDLLIPVPEHSRQVSAGSQRISPQPQRIVLPGQEASVARAMEVEEGLSKDDLLQEAIKEHEADRLAFAAQLFRRAARGEAGLPMGQLMYGLSLRHGWGIAQDEKEALAWLRLAASGAATLVEGGQTSSISEGLILAIYELGNSMRYGWGAERDPVLARSYYETAANLGDIDAMTETAWCYETGFGMDAQKKKDKRKAAYWYRRAEEKAQAIPGNQWIWKPKYDGNPFLVVEEEKRKGLFRR